MIRYQSSELILEISRQYGSVQYLDGKGKLLLQERQENPRLLEEFEARILAEELIATVEEFRERNLPGSWNYEIIE